MTPEEMFKHAEDIKCEECGSTVFREVYVLKKISKLIAATDKDQVVPVPTFACLKCGHINDEIYPKAPAVQTLH